MGVQGRWKELLAAAKVMERMSHPMPEDEKKQGLSSTGPGTGFLHPAHNPPTTITEIEHCKIDWEIVTTSFILVSSSQIAIKRRSLTSSSQGVSLNYVPGLWQV